jgi:16S rRNA (cytosine967-C5)-methyltransferase
MVDTDCMLLANGTKVSEWLPLDKWAVVQDASSQKTGQLLKSLITPGVWKYKVWDCCAASGGKSIMIHDLLGPVSLTVSDIRPSILANLRKRFQNAGISADSTLVADLTKGLPAGLNQQFDLVIADVPCTGSGTWARTPEQLAFFDPGSIPVFAKRQTVIACQAWEALRNKGYLVYITCSVFHQENEEVVQQVTAKTGANAIFMQSIDGTASRADSMFMAVLQKK